MLFNNFFFSSSVTHIITIDTFNGTAVGLIKMDSSPDVAIGDGAGK